MQLTALRVAAEPERYADSYGSSEVLSIGV